LRANFRWTFAGNVIYAACQWALLSILAKAGNTATVGQFALGLAIGAPVFMFTNLQLRAVQATDARSEFEFADYFTLRLIGSALGLFVVGTAAFSLHFDLATRMVVFLVGVSKAIESLGDVVAGLLQKFERLDQVAISLVIRGGFSAIGFGTIYVCTHNLVIAVLVLCIAWAAVFVGYDLRCAAKVLDKNCRVFHFSFLALKRLLYLSAPLGLVMTLISLNTNIPRYVIARHLGRGDLGIFASLAYLLVTVNLVVNSLGQSATARLSRSFAQRDLKGFRHVMRRLQFLALSIILLGVPLAAVSSRWLLTVLYTAEYGATAHLFVLMTLTAGVSSSGSFCGYGMTAARSFRAQVPIIMASTLVCALLSLGLVPRLGLMGAAYALLFSALVMAAALGYSLRRALVGEESR
jgi:O-antigen/teichoic acid export membrane protein